MIAQYPVAQIRRQEHWGIAINCHKMSGHTSSMQIPPQNSILLLRIREKVALLPQMADAICQEPADEVRQAPTPSPA